MILILGKDSFSLDDEFNCLIVEWVKYELILILIELVVVGNYSNFGSFYNWNDSFFKSYVLFFRNGYEKILKRCLVSN